MCKEYLTRILEVSGGFSRILEVLKEFYGSWQDFRGPSNIVVLEVLAGFNRIIDVFACS